MFTFINLHPLRRPFSRKKKKRKKGRPRLPCRVKKVSDSTDSPATEVGEMLLLLLCHGARLGERYQVSSQQQRQRVSLIAHTQQQQQHFQSGFLSVGLSFSLGSRSHQISSQRNLDWAQFSLKISGTLLLKYCVHNPADLGTMRRVVVSWSKWKGSRSHSGEMVC